MSGSGTGPPLDFRQRYSDLHETTQVAHDGRQAQIHTAQPGIVQSFDAEKMTMKVQPAIQGMQTMTDGTVQPITCQPLQDVPVHFPAGGGYTLTFPITKGDEAQLIHQHRSLDYWHQQGGTQPISDYRMHDINDAIAMVGLRNATRPLKDVHTSAAQFRSDDGQRFVEIDSGKNTIRIMTPHTTIVIDDSKGTITLSSPTEIVLETPKLTFKGDTIGMNANQSLNIEAPHVTIKSPDFQSGA